MRLVNSISKGKRRVYDIEVDEVHNFYANGLNVHNCATNGGVSVIKDDGTVVDLTSTVYLDYGLVAFTDTGGLIAVNRLLSGSYVYIHGWDSIPNADRINSVDSIITSAAIPTYLRNTGYVVDNTDNAFATDGGLTLLERHPTVAQSSVAYITSDYNSGYMTGDIKGAWLSDTDTTSLGTELGGNGTFGGTARLASHTYTSGDLTFSLTEDSNTGTSEGYVKVNFNGVIGRTYSVDIQCDTAFTATNDTRLETVTAPVTSFAGQGTTDLRSLTFTQTSSLSGMYLYGSPVTGSTVSYTISVKLADADRSVNNNGLQVHGTITKTAVA